ncbi:histidine kinase [Achromobacter aloeverae]|uniref:histidine kinase n=1 Tax=Achromobacter aloeverae TaxID=1750518 RepID=A0A4Q1HKE8_9BURK|nr:histidine kinase [Achromobacter aloeverae]
MITGCTLVRAQSTVLHITEAQRWSSSSKAWLQPASMDALDAGDQAMAAADADWRQVSLPDIEPRVFWPRGMPAAALPEVWWYRMHIPADALASQGTRLYVPRWQATGTLAVYVNGRRAWQSRGDRAWNNFNHPLWVDLGGLLPPGRDAWVYVRMASQPNVGGALSSIWVGPVADLLPRWRWRAFLQTGLPAYWRGAFMVLGVLALGLAAWLRINWRRHRELASAGGARPFALFFCMAVGQALGALLFLVNDEGLDMNFAWFSWITLVGMLSVPVCAFHFLGVVQHRPRPRLGRVLVVYWLVVVVATLPTWWTDHPGIVPLQRLAILPPVLAQIYAAVANAWARRNAANVLLAAWGPLSLLMAWHDMAMQNYRLDIEGIYLTPYVNLGLLTLFLILAFTRYTHALESAVRARSVLDERLAAQARELIQAHERVRNAEREQTLLNERQRLMSDMHDGVGSSLMSALRLVEMGKEPVNIAQVLKECIDDLKIAIDSLESADADLLALLGALRFRLGPRLTGAGIALRWRMSDLPPLPWLDAQSALHVLRILQEVLTNIVKHGAASEITVTTAVAQPPAGMVGEGVQVCVQDNGRPFTPSTEARLPGRRGLANVRNRVSTLGAHCAWQPLQEGTSFTLWLPLVRPGT